jgi:hypothetical protein
MTRSYIQDYNLLVNAGLSHKEADAIAVDCHNPMPRTLLTRNGQCNGQYGNFVVGPTAYPDVISGLYYQQFGRIKRSPATKLLKNSEYGKINK